MSTKGRRPGAVARIATTTAGLLLLASPVAAQEADREADACFTAAERAQPLMRDGRLREARAELEMCARDVCPRVARVDCRDWLAHVAAQQPTIVIAARETNARGETRDATGVRAVIDGGITIERAVGAEIPLDPGPHRVRVERAGVEPLDQRVEVREGEKGRVVDFHWQTDWVPEPAPGGRAGADGAAPVGAYVLGALGLVAALGGTYLEVSGLNKRASLWGCRPTCPQQKVDDAFDVTLAGDLTVGAGVAMLAGAAIFYLARQGGPPRAPPQEPPQEEVDLLVQPLRGGLIASWHGSL